MFRILIDLKARFQGTPISTDVNVDSLIMDKTKKDKLKEISHYFSKVYKNSNIIDDDLMSGFEKIKETCSLLELYELITQNDLTNIADIVDKSEVSIFIRTTTNINCRNYISHPRNYFTKNIVTLSLDNEL